MSLLVTCETLGLFLNALIADDKYLFCNSENLLQPSQMQFSRYRKLLLNFLLNFSNLHQISNILKSSMTLIAYGFPKLQTPNCLVKPMFIKRRFRTPLDSQYVKGSQTLAKSA